MKRLFILLGVFFMSSSILFAQTEDMTPYEKSRYELAEQAVEKIMEVSSAGDKLALAIGYSQMKEEAEDVFDLINKAEEFISTLCGISSYFGCEADYLSRSFSAEKQYTGNLLNSYAAIGEWYSNERNIIENSKTDNDIKREWDRYYQRLGQSRIISKISNEFAAWAQKGELEKTANYNQRIAERSHHVLDSLCFIAVNEHWKDKKTFKIEKGQYNADDETLEIIMSVRDNQGNIVASVNGSCTIPIDDYKVLDFKVKNEYSWAHDMFEVNHVLFPSSAKLYFPLRGYYSSNLYTVTFAEGQNFSISGKQLKGLSEELQSKIVDYNFSYPAYSKDLTIGLEVRAKFKQTYNGLPHMLKEHAEKIHFECDDEEFMDSKKANRMLDDYVDNCTRSFYESCFGHLDSWLQDAFSYAVIKEKLIKGTDEDIKICITDLAAKEFVKYAPAIEKTDFKSNTGNRAVQYLVEGYNYFNGNLNELCYSDEIMGAIISASPFLSKELQKYQKKYEGAHPEFITQRSNPEIKHEINSVFYRTFIQSIRYGRFFY